MKQLTDNLHANKNVECDYKKVDFQKVFDMLKSEYYRVMNSVDAIDNIFLGKTTAYIAIFGAIVAVYGEIAISNYLAILLPFLLAYFGYNTLKYTLKILEYNGYAIALEKYMNLILKCDVLNENQLFADNNGIKGKNIYKRGLYRVFIQAAFVIPIGIFTGYAFFNSLIIMELAIWIKIFIVALLALAGCADLFLVYLCTGMVSHATTHMEESWKLKEIELYLKSQQNGTDSL